MENYNYPRPDVTWHTEEEKVLYSNVLCSLNIRQNNILRSIKFLLLWKIGKKTKNKGKNKNLKKNQNNWVVDIRKSYIEFMTACMKYLQSSFYARMYTRHRIINKMPIPRFVLPSSVLTELMFLFLSNSKKTFVFAFLSLL